MMKFFFLLLSAIVSNYCLGQNLVPNPSFEDTVECPQPLALVSKARFWYAVEESPDYFHECVGNGYFSVPQNSWGYQWPATGEGYLGMVTYSTIDTFYHEAIGTSLNQPLIVGQKYFVNFKACLAFSPNKGANIAVNGLGMLFSTTDYLASPPPRNNFAQVYSASIISDSSSWTNVRGSFIADSAYQFLSIGSFFDNSHTDTSRFYANSWYQSYYFIDDVCVSTDSNYCEIWTSLPERLLTGSDISVSPNPAWHEITVDNLPYDCKEIQVYDIEGKLLRTVRLFNDFVATINISSLPEGMYSIIIRRERTIQLKKFIKSF